jgi:hypothetical protein
LYLPENGIKKNIFSKIKGAESQIRVKENNEKFNCSNEVKTKSTEYFYIGGRNS